MTFIDFAPFMNRFKNMQKYIEAIKDDISDPAYFFKIDHRSANAHSYLLLDEQDLETFMQSNYCRHLPYACMMNT